jgi:hypothetical protein
MMGEIPNRSKFFTLTADVVAYKETTDRDDSESYDLHTGDDLFGDVNEKVRRLKGRNVNAIVFSVGVREGFYWMPREEFHRLTTEVDPSKRTSRPFER